MNDLSWLLYWADVAGAIQEMLLYAGMGGAASYFLWSFFITTNPVGEYDQEEVKEAKIAYKKSIWKMYPFIICAFLASLSAFAPSKQAIYLIAGSEAGEYVVTSPEGQEMINDIKAIIKAQIKELTP